MNIIGAGMAGLVVANIFRKQKPRVYELQDSLPNNHHALLRFRSEAIAHATGIPFKKVRVDKCINYLGHHYDKPTIQMANDYSYKVSGEIKSRSIWNMDSSERFIAPTDLVSQMADGLDIVYNFDFLKHIKKNIDGLGEPIISTVPMHLLMDALGWEDKPDFKTKEIWSMTGELPEEVDVYQTIYYPNRDLPFYRVSITGRKVIVEFIKEVEELYNWKEGYLTNQEYMQHFLQHDFGIHYFPEDIEVKHQKYGKLISSDPKTCKRFIAWASNKYNIYSLGRWATHRQILMDDIVQDAEVIKKLIETEGYGR